MELAKTGRCGLMAPTQIRVPDHPGAAGWEARPAPGELPVSLPHPPAEPDRPDGPPPTSDTDAPDSSGPDPLPLALAAGLVALGGAAGAAGRYELELIVPAAADGFPWATILVNVSGALVLGALLTLLSGSRVTHPVARVARPLLATGVIGAYTTWSTYMVEVAVLVRGGTPGVAAAYLAASLVAGVAAAAAGVVGAGRWSRAATAGEPQ
jgi:CrcB protein